MIAFRFYLEAPTWQMEFLFLTSNNLVNRWSNFLELRFFTVTEGPGDIGLLSVNILGVETIYASRIALYCC